MIAVRWVARILGLLLVGLFIVFAVGTGFNPLKFTGTEVALASVLIVALAGMILLWRQEFWGGVAVVAGMVAFYSINFATSGAFPGGFVFPLCFLPGILAICSWWNTRAIAGSWHQ